MHDDAPPHLWLLHDGASPHLWLLHDGASPHLWLLHDGAPPHLWLLHNGASPHLWLMHDGAPPHFLPAFRKFLNNLFPKKLIGSGSPTASPSRSPDINSFDFYLLEHLRSSVHCNEVIDLQNL